MTLSIALTDDITACLALRRAVFIEEQRVPEAEEVDGRDGEATHLLARLHGRPVGTARLLRSGNIGKIGRVCVLAELRGQGLGAALIDAAVSHLAATGCTEARLGAQMHAVEFYTRLGFEGFGPEYLDAGITHRDMRMVLAARH